MAMKKICIICGNHFIRKGKRAKTAKYCSIKCRGIGMRKRETIHCQNCGCSFEIKDFEKSRNRKFCSRDCDFANRKKHPSRLGKPICGKQAEVLRNAGLSWKGKTKENNVLARKRASLLKERYANDSNLRQQRSEIAKEVWKKRKLDKKAFEKFRKKMSKIVKQNIAENPELHIRRICTREGFESSLERIMREALSESGIEFKKEFQIDKFFVDFAIISHRIVIEVDGDYWHQDKEKDFLRDQVIESYNWKVLRFSETSVKKDISGCIKKIHSSMSL